MPVIRANDVGIYIVLEFLAALPAAWRQP